MTEIVPLVRPGDFNVAFAKGGNMEEGNQKLVQELKAEHKRLQRKYPATEDHGVLRALEERISYLERDLEVSKNLVDKQLSG